MAWTTPRSWSAGELVTASIMNTHIRDNENELRGGGIAIASQAALDFIYGSSATQFARLAATVGGSGQTVRLNAAANGYEFANPASTFGTTNTSVASPTPNADVDGFYELTAQAATAAFQTPSGTPRNRQRLVISIKDNGTARSITWTSGYVAAGVALPSTTVLGKWLNLCYLYSTSLSKWQLVAASQEA